MKILKISTAVIAMIVVSLQANAQDEDQKSNIQTFTPSKLLNKGQWDIKFFNSIYTETEGVDDEGNKSDIARQTFFTNTTEVFTGVSDNNRINIGAIFQFRSNTIGGAGALEVLQFKNDGETARAGFTTFAPSIRVQPFANIGNFSFTSSFYIPIFEDKVSSVYLDKRSFFWETRFFYDKTFGGDKWQLFTELDIGYNFGENSKDADPTSENVGERFANNSFFVPVSAFLSFFPSSKSTIFGFAQQAFLIDAGNDFSQNYTQLGIGGKYQITNVLNLEASYGKFVRGSATGLGNVFSIGLRALL